MKKGLFIGLSTIDIQYFTDIFPTPNQKIKTAAPIISIGGPSANAAITYSFLGGKAEFLTCFGENNFTRAFENEFRKFNIDVVDAKINIEMNPIISAIITTTVNSERTIFTHNPHNHPELNQNLDILKRIKEFDFVFSDGFYPELSIAVCKHAKMNNIPVIFDGGSWKKHLYKLLPYINIAICSENFYPPNCIKSDDVFGYLKQFNINHMAISRGKKSILTNNGIIKIENINASDSLGAGDILHGAFCYYYQKSNEFLTSLEMASKISTFSTKHLGTRTWMNYFEK